MIIRIIKNIEVCIDRIIPFDQIIKSAKLSCEENKENTPNRNIIKSFQNEIYRFHHLIPIHLNTDTLADEVKMALFTNKKWKPGRTLKISFLDGEEQVKEKVAEVAKIWNEFADLPFDFGDHSDAEIRISFRDKGSWSYIGTDSLTVPISSPTMNFGWLSNESTDDQYRSVVLHEFGHALGCFHEHQHPKNGIKWNKDEVYKYCSGSPNYWTKEQIDRNIFEKYSEDITQFSEFDPKSIMIYPIPPQLTLDGFSTTLPTQLSDTDKEFIQRIYPEQQYIIIDE